ncbi:hypothetical protein PVK06_042349 [Gossypium arboreum]|uniref:Uncharacterized protein n=1 Tax=Gossypium arboreum TaxID=29729 RepID=A0ABR0MKG9_GOSAR|nr:hypothetical protein PVK06_042349 [Gossypium arboreum]
MEARDTQFPSSMQRVYNHTQGRSFTTRFTGGWTNRYGDLCKAFLGKVPNKFQGGWIDMKWLENNFKELSKDASDIVKEQYAQTFILRMKVTY